ncbi:chorismate mutase [Micromonospora sp. R77]|uniref:chorismate mutase n=1 Tax=Micromonospora sp. R77 TaxID=2925836 RepID=UPI001F6100F4|nr:chorismate mutase [Micromonospora sp. R77]MCI4061229.1 chorismate mutase [Micromonospora sp. R77]
MSAPRSSTGHFTIRAVRGAVQVPRDDPDAIGRGTVELLTEVLARNALTVDDLVSVLFTATPDLRSAFPAAAARRLGLHDVPLLCATEIDVPDAPPRIIRLLAHVHTDLPRTALTHVYLAGAATLRPDLPTPNPPTPSP